MAVPVAESPRPRRPPNPPRRRRRARRRRRGDPLPGLPVAARRQGPVLCRLRLLFLARTSWPPPAPAVRRARRAAPRRPSACKTASRSASKVSERQGVQRYPRPRPRATPPAPVVDRPPAAAAVGRSRRAGVGRGRRRDFADGDGEEDILPGFDELPGRRRRSHGDPAGPAGLAERRLGAEPAPGAGTPRAAARRRLLRRRQLRVSGRGSPAGPPLWDAWDDPEADAEQRFGWLAQIAEVLHCLHQAGRHPRRRCGRTSSSSRRTARRG